MSLFLYEVVSRFTIRRFEQRHDSRQYLACAKVALWESGEVCIQEKTDVLFSELLPHLDQFFSPCVKAPCEKRGAENYALLDGFRRSPVHSENLLLPAKPWA